MGPLLADRLEKTERHIDSPVETKRAPNGALLDSNPNQNFSWTSTPKYRGLFGVPNDHAPGAYLGVESVAEVAILFPPTSRKDIR
jgi:hypothetical protein